jgi:hypothetical protein
VELSEDQLVRFAGNAIMLQGTQKIIVMSSQAFEALSNDQLSQLGSHAKVVHSNLETIEKYGGGSARCMIAEIF